MFGDLSLASPSFDDPIGMLRSCHRRIERAVELINRVAALAAGGPLSPAAREALRHTLSYFASGVPRHARDEEESLFPRLLSAVGPGGEPAAISTLEDDHRALDAIHAEVDALGRELLDAGRFDHPEKQLRFAALAGALRERYGEHIRVEDDEILPLAAELMVPGELEAIGAEMAQRRGIEWGRHRELLAGFGARRW